MITIVKSSLLSKAKSLMSMHVMLLTIMLLIVNFNSFGQKEKIYTDVDVKAMYKGKNVEEIRSDIQKNQVYPKSAKEQKISAKIYVQFVIDENGKVVDIEAVRTNIMDNSGENILVKDFKPGSNSKIDAKSVADLEAEAIRAVKCLDGFTPAQKDGKKVRTQLTTSVSFFYDFLNITQILKNISHPGNVYTIEKSYENSNVDGYNLYIPNSCTKDSKAFPVIVFLQGGLGVGGKVDAIFNWELPKELKETNELGSELKELKLNTFVYVMPHISKGQFYENVDAISKVIEEVSKNYNIDEHRIYLTGLSRGGHGTWGVASKIPEMFAAIAPICGASHGIDDYKKLVNLPIWTAHNTSDNIVNYNETQNIVMKIEEVSGKKFSRTKTISEVDYANNDLIFTSGEGDQKGHNAWEEVYNNVNFYKWLLRFKK